MFNKILIANRGEIAVRVIKTARRMGIKTVVVYSDADEGSLAVEMADEKVHIGPSPASQSYLVADKIIDACKQTGAQAVHPGFGFLSENQGFAQRLKDEGIVFIGPNPYAIGAMGDKIESKKAAQAAGVSCVPGFIGEIRDTEHALEISKDIGYPVMIKASAGGGGKGIRIAYNDQEVLEGFPAVKAEAIGAFGDDRIFIEKFITAPRHIEIQIIADSHGNVVHLGERDCSLQRRHQKVWEEAPSPALNSHERDEIGEIVVKAIKSLGYLGVGTIEFLYENGKFYFIEMNTRLQVEHPVTEAITGIDLVREQIRIAAGLPLSFTQDDIVFNGVAIECRINAEDPVTFAPSPGTITDYHPPGGLGVRMDSAIYAGYKIPPYYDSLLGKLIVHGKNRAECLMRLKRSLGEMVIGGTKTTTPLFQRLLQERDIIDGNYNIHWLEKWMDSNKPE